MKKLVIAAASLALAGCAGLSPDPQAKVKITPLGSHDGEFCVWDRALVFEDPDGTRILYDPGRTVRGPNDESLGRIDAVLLSHVHGDHLGDLIQPSAERRRLPKPDFSVNVAPNSNFVNIAMGKQAPMVVGGEMHTFFQAKVASLGGDPASSCAWCASARKPWSARSMVASVPAVHANGVPPAFLPKRTGAGAQRRRAYRLCRAPGRLRAALLERPHRLPLRRHRHHRRAGPGGARPLQGQPGGDEHRRLPFTTGPSNRPTW